MFTALLNNIIKFCSTLKFCEDMDSYLSLDPDADQ